MLLLLLPPRPRCPKRFACVDAAPASAPSISRPEVSPPAAFHSLPRPRPGPQLRAMDLQDHSTIFASRCPRSRPHPRSLCTLSSAGPHHIASKQCLRLGPRPSRRMSVTIGSLRRPRCLVGRAEAGLRPAAPACRMRAPRPPVGACSRCSVRLACAALRLYVRRRSRAACVSGHSYDSRDSFGDWLRGRGDRWV